MVNLVTRYPQDLRTRVKGYTRHLAIIEYVTTQTVVGESLMSLASSYLTKSLRMIFVPHLREDGFKGSGKTFYRVINDWVQVVNIQNARRGGSFAVNLGLQPLSVPDCLGNPVDPRKITEPLCAFRRRLSEVGCDQWWGFEDSIQSVDGAVTAAGDVYVRVGRPLLNSILCPDSPFLTVTPNDFINDRVDFRGFDVSTKVRNALTLGRLRKSEGKDEDAEAFAIYGLQNIERGVGLIPHFEALIRRGQ